MACGGKIVMRAKIMRRLILAASAGWAGILFFSSPASAATCTSSLGGCPVVTEVTHLSGNNYSVRWMHESFAQYWVSAQGSTNMQWGLYLITNYTFSSHYVYGGSYTPLMIVNRQDPPQDQCTPGGMANDPNGQYCEHTHYAARFLTKYGATGTLNVTIPAGVTNSCIVFGVPSRLNAEFYTVFTGFASVPVCGPGGISVPEPEPDPEWCGMSTSTLSFDFGDMSPTSVANSSQTKSAVMACSKAGLTYNLYLSGVTTAGRNTIDLGRGVTATVSVDNQALQTNRTSIGTVNTLSVKVTLSGVPSSTGPISGTGILAVNYL